MKRSILLTLMVLGVMVAIAFATNTTTQPLAATCVRQASSIIALQTTPQSPFHRPAAGTQSTQAHSTAASAAESASREWR